MRVAAKQIHASPHPKLNWISIKWKKVRKKVQELQMRIAKAVREGKLRLAKSLQWLLTHSFYGKLMAIRRVVTNKGKSTPGVDGVVWNSPKKKMQAVNLLNRRGYRPYPLRRVYIKKKNGKLRPLSIPTMRDRAMQALYALALVPAAETIGDPNSYGFRDGRCCADAIVQCYICLANRHSARWILEADIQACFDRIDHEWMLNSILIDKKILRSWLNAGYIDKGKLYPTKAGTPQGAIISPVLANLVLDGLETAVKHAVPKTAKVNVIRYADDFIVTGESKQILQQKVMPAIRCFLSQRGLNLSGEKTRITRIEDGFDFLGQNLRKYGNKFLAIPSKSSVKGIISKTRKIIKFHLGSTTVEMLQELNPVIRGWANYHRHSCSKNAFYYIDSCIFKNLWRWAKRRHPSKKAQWIRNRYFRTIGNRNWCFFATQKTEGGVAKVIDLLYMGTVKIVRHTKIRAKANPYDNRWQEYFSKRSIRTNYSAIELALCC
ncbi:MAG: group II intron reverse transcriptase/maturase [Deltaproteobacteria bacterium]|jgi:RNA-directed DNA polymerase|nr:group II intron reverse transcriptase/maturase [Deltaproteobacteria bacterium]